MKPSIDKNWISKLQLHITSNSNKIFGNGRQQLEVSVSVTPKSGVEFTQEQLDSIRLMTLDDDGNHQALGGELQVSTDRDTRFEYYADTGSAPSALLESNIRRRRFYVSSTRTGGSLDVIYAAITKDEDNEYVSSNPSYFSSQTIETLTPLRLIRDDFTWLVEDNFVQEIGDTKWDYDVYQLFLRGRSLRLVESIPYGPRSGEGYYQKIVEEEDGWLADGEMVWSWTHYAYEISDKRRFKVKKATLSVERRPASMVFIRIKTAGSVNLSGVTNRSSHWGLIDQYGNEHKIEMTQESNGNLINFIMN